MLLLADACLYAAEGMIPVKGTTVGETGTITFKLETDQNYKNGQGQENYRQTLIRLPGISEIGFSRSDSSVNLSWIWDRRGESGGKFNDIIADLTDLPGPEKYFLQYTWDSAQGLSEAYFNGIPLRIPGALLSPWWTGKELASVDAGTGRIKVRAVAVESRYTPPEEALAAVPKEFRGRHSDLIGFAKPPQPIDISTRRGALLYESRMDNPGSVTGWVKEGPLDLRFDDGYMQMRSAAFAGNTVFWCPQEFPESFVAEWEFEPLSHYGLAIIFFAARGEHGEDIFDPSLPKRDGNFNHYIKGAITSYHVSYFANVEDYQMGRIDSNLRKNNKFYRVGGGPVAIPPGTEGWQRMRLIKDGSRIQLFANGKISVDWTDDDPERYGPPLAGGKIGLRQMTQTIGAYRNFRVLELKGAN
ncbi:MAG: DUF1961 family protein [Kiritimatiellales bacterium]